MKNFSVTHHNYGHWDISTKEERIYRIRGGSGKYYVLGENSHHDADPKYFKTVNACMAYICDILMFELIIAEGQEPKVIESWNI